MFLKADRYHKMLQNLEYLHGILISYSTVPLEDFNPYIFGHMVSDPPL